MAALSTASRPHAVAIATQIATANGPLIVEALRKRAEALRDGATVLEVGSGFGQHVATLAGAFPRLHVQPSDKNDENFESVRAWSREFGTRVREPIVLDLTDEQSFGKLPRRYDMVFACNVVQVVPWPICVNLFKCAASALSPGGALVLYSPLGVFGSLGSDSVVEFDKFARSLNPAFGVRFVEELEKAASPLGLYLVEVISSPTIELPDYSGPRDFKMAIFERRARESPLP